MQVYWLVSRWAENCSNGLKGLTHFKSLFYFYIPWKNQKSSGFLMFLGGYRKRLLAWNGLIFNKSSS